MIAWIIIGVLFVITWIVVGVSIGNLKDRENEAHERLNVHRDLLDSYKRELGLGLYAEGSLRDQLKELKHETGTQIAMLFDYLDVEEKNDPPKNYLVKRKGKK